MGAGAYLCWGLFPLYWPLLDPAGSLEALAHRIVWSLVFVGLLLTVTHRWYAFRAIWSDRRRIGFLALASVVIAVNSSPGLEGIATATGKDIAGLIIAYIVKHCKTGKTRTKGAG